MSQADHIDATSSEKLPAEPASLAGDYLRGLAQSLSKFDDFNGFLETLAGLIDGDRYLKGSAKLVDLDAAEGLPDFEVLEPDDVVLAVAGSAGSYGHLKYSGRSDGRLFAAEDLHLMGSLATLLSSLIAQAGRYKKRVQAYRMLQFLVNQLPLGVVCYDADGDRIVCSRLSQRLLGDNGESLLRDQLGEVTANPKQRYQAHLQIESRLIYTEGRVLQLEDGASVIAFVLYDMSSSQEKMRLELERGIYLSASRDEPHTIVLLEERSSPGQLYRALKERSKDSAFNVSSVLAVDAFTCLCMFEGQRMLSVRYLLRHSFKLDSHPNLSVSLLGAADFAAGDAPSTEVLESAKAALKPFSELCRIELLVLDAYPATAASLQLMAGDGYSVWSCSSLEEVERLLSSGLFDGLIVDLDAYHGAALERLRSAVLAGGVGVKLIFTSCLHAAAARQTHGLGKRDLIVHKPFDARIVEDLLAVQFELS